MADSTDDPEIQRTDRFDISNEFAQVTIYKVLTRNGERLEISAPKLGRHIRLDAMELESLAWQSTETFSRFLETPFGTEDE
jgi:hypothetical protein